MLPSSARITSRRRDAVAVSGGAGPGGAWGAVAAFAAGCAALMSDDLVIRSDGGPPTCGDAPTACFTFGKFDSNLRTEVVVGVSLRPHGPRSSGQLGDGTTTNRATPVQVVGLTSGVRASASSSAARKAVTEATAITCRSTRTPRSSGRLPHRSAEEILRRACGHRSRPRKL